MEEQRVEAREALLKFAGLAVAIAVVLGLATFLLVRVLGIGGGTASERRASAQTTSTPSQLPTVALTPSGSASASASPSDTATPTSAPTGLTLAANPPQVRPGQRIFLTGQYVGADGVRLVVQRQTDGTWEQFADVSLVTRAGAFSTYIITSRTGITLFRLLDPTTGVTSNEVSVTIG